MALIEKKHVIERETVSYKLNRSTIELVKSYAEYLESPQEYVVNQALIYLFRKDRDFHQWLKVNGKPDLAVLARSLANRKRRGENRSSRTMGEQPVTE